MKGLSRAANGMNGYYHLDSNVHVSRFSLSIAEWDHKSWRDAVRAKREKNWRDQWYQRTKRGGLAEWTPLGPPYFMGVEHMHSTCHYF